MQNFIDQFISRLDGKIQDQELQIVKTELVIFLKDFDLVKKNTELAPFEEDIPRILKEYLFAKKMEGKTPATLKHYYYLLSNFFRSVNKPVEKITTGDIQYYIYELERNRSLKGVSLQNVQITIKAFFKWLFIYEYIEKNPCDKIPTMKVEKPMRKPLSDIEMEKLRRACKTKRDKAILETLYATGCRVSELTGIKLSDIDFDKREVHLFGKGRKHRESFFSARATVALKEYIENERISDSDHVFVSTKAPHGPITQRNIEKIMKRLGESAGIEESVFPHRIRHTTATDALDKGMNIEEVQYLLGHESIATTLKYTEIKKENVKRDHHRCII